MRPCFRERKGSVRFVAEDEFPGPLMTSVRVVRRNNKTSRAQLNSADRFAFYSPQCFDGRGRGPGSAGQGIAGGCAGSRPEGARLRRGEESQRCGDVRNVSWVLTPFWEGVGRNPGTYAASFPGSLREMKEPGNGSAHPATFLFSWLLFYSSNICSLHLLLEFVLNEGGYATKTKLPEVIWSIKNWKRYTERGEKTNAK